MTKDPTGELPQSDKPNDSNGGVEAARRIVGGWQRSLSQTGYYEEDDPLRVARALLSSTDRERKYREALEEIAKQEQSPDMTVDQQLDGDFEGAYNWMIEIARSALPTEQDK